MARYVMVKEDRFEPENQDEESVDLEEYEALLGNAMDSEQTRDRWLDAVERIMEDKAFENGKKHSRRNFHEVRYDGDYGIRDGMPG